MLRTQRRSLTVHERLRSRGAQKWPRDCQHGTSLHIPPDQWPLTHDCQLSDKKPALYAPASSVVHG